MTPLKRRWIRSLLTALVSFTLVAPAYVTTARAEAPAPGNRPVPHNAPRAQVDPKLQADLAAGGRQTFLVKLTTDADVNGAAETARAAAAAAGKTPHGQRLARGQAVVNSLHDVADKSQAGVRQQLDQLQKSGAVTAYEPFWVVNAIAVTGDAQALAKLAERADVAKITPNQTYQLLGGPQAAATPSVATGSVEWNIQQIGAPDVWSLGIDGTGIVVANLDTGVDGNHPALARKWRGADGSNPAYSWFDAVNDQNSFPYDDHNHGTHTMGTIVGSEASGANQIGVAPGARWIAAKILSAGGSGNSVDILEAGQWLLAPGGDPAMAPDVVSNSWGGGPGLDEWFRSTVQAWRAAGIVPVFAAGNDGPGNGTVAKPGNYPEAITVGAVDSNNLLASFSSRGPSPYGEIKPEVSAPGVNVRSAVPGGGYQGGWNGTSMATPHVAGTAALLLQANASLTPDEIEQILTSTATPRTDSTYPAAPNNGYGHGVINAYAAVSSLLTGGTLSGRVGRSGDDLEPPVITHTPLPQTFAGSEIPVSAQVTDNVSVTEVNLYARVHGDAYYTVIPMQRTAGDYKSGTYQAVIPGYLVQAPSTDYYIRALDYGNNPVTTPVTAIQVLRGMQPGWTTDLETNPDWSHGGNNDPWAWGVPTSGPGSAHSGKNVYATNLSGNYADNTNAYLLTPPLDLTGVSQAQFNYWNWLDVESCCDTADVWAIDAAGTQYLLQRNNFPTGGWQMSTVDLSQFAGQVIRLMFNFTSDYVVNYAGWYLDDMALLAPDAVPPAAPTGLTGTSDGTGWVTLTWNRNPEPDMDYYRVYRSLTGGVNYSEIGITAGPVYVDGTASLGVPNYYVVAAVDRWGNPSQFSAEFAITPTGPQTLFFDNMENGENGWTHGGTMDPWQLGTPASGPGYAWSGANVWATNRFGNYTNYTDAWLMSPPISLAGATSASLQFAQWYDIEYWYDNGRVEVSTDGGVNWMELTRFTGFSGGYSQASLDLSPFLGQTINIRFRLTSDVIVTANGWFIDDVRVVAANTTATTEGAPAPAKTPQKTDRTPLYKPAQPGQYSQVPAGGTSGGTSIGITSLPLEGVVTILETGRSVHTDPATGAYAISHPSGSFTARAEAYGFAPQDVAVTIPANGQATQNFVLQPLPRGKVQGIVTNARTGQPLAGATVQQLEDGHVPAVTTDAAGAFTLDLFQGVYTLRFTAPDFKPFLAKVTVPGNGTAVQDAALEPYITLPDELTYDDGTAESATVWDAAGNGWAVRMTPSGQAKGLLQSASFRLWDASWPVPGSDSFAVAVYDSTGPNGAPGKQLAGPIPATGVRGEWARVDLSGLGLTFDKEFYVVFVQTGSFPETPAIAVDKDGPNAGRAWGFAGGGFFPVPDQGNFLIRATLVYEVEPPRLKSPADGTIINQPVTTVAGTSIDGATVVIYDDGMQIAELPVAGGWFKADVTLHENANVLTAVARVPSGETRPSAPVTVTVDSKAPVLEVATPTEFFVTNRDAVTVTGTVTDDHIAGVTVNDQEVTLTGGSFSQKVLVNEGDNLITVIARDAAGNSMGVVRHVTVDTAAPTISGLQPAADLTVEQGQPLTIAFDSEPGLTAGYQIVLSGASGGALAEPNMQETSPGHYQGTYTAPAGTLFTGATIQVWATDAAGNRTDAAAAGHLTVVAPNQPPVAQIVLPAKVKAKSDLTFDGSTSSDSDGTIVRYVWSFGDGATAEGPTVTHRYSTGGTYPVTLTVTDDRGAANTQTVTLTLK